MRVMKSEIDGVEAAVASLAARDFTAFRYYMHPALKQVRFQLEIISELYKWRKGQQAGTRPTLIINTPPQHGKSTLMVDWCAWLLGNDPTLRIIYASFSERLAVRANLALQRIMLSPKYAKVFPAAALLPSHDTLSNRNRSLVETSLGGYFRNTTVRGSITGESLDIGVIDDPIKGREAANSETIRDSTWDWFTDDWLTRFSDKGAMISIATRWHVDDPIGRLLAYDKRAKVLSYPAIDSEGNALAPELKPLDFLLERKAILSTEAWASLYQQTPIVTGGNLIHPAAFKRYETLPKLKYLRIFVDTAAKIKERNDYTVFALWGAGVDGVAYLIDLLRGKWEYGEMKYRVIAFWDKAAVRRLAPLRDMVVEDKSSGIQLIQELRSAKLCPVTPINRTTDKYTRLQAVIGYLENGYAAVPARAPWLSDFLSECEAFTGAGDTHDDQVDTLIDAMQYLVAEEQGEAAIWENII